MHDYYFYSGFATSRIAELQSAGRGPRRRRRRPSWAGAVVAIAHRLSTARRDPVACCA